VPYAYLQLSEQGMAEEEEESRESRAGMASGGARHGPAGRGCGAMAVLARNRVMSRAEKEGGAEQRVAALGCGIGSARP
jgi:hypothetical protein